MDGSSAQRLKEENMSEYEIWSVMNSGLIANAIYGASVFFILWVAFRAANQVRAEGSNIVIKSLVTLFGISISIYLSI